WLPALLRAPERMFRALGLRASILRALDVEDGVVLRLSGRLPFWPGPGLFLAPVRVLWRAFRFDPRRFRSDPGLRRALQRTRELEKRDLAPLDWAGLHRHLREVEGLPELVAGELRGKYMWRAVLGVARLRLLLAVVQRKDRLGALLSGTDSLTSEANAALETLAAQVRARPELMRVFGERDGVELLGALRETPEGRELLGALQGFLDEHGHREVLISTAREPTWKDAPELVLSILKGLSAAAPPPPPAKKEWEQARDDVLAGSALGRAPLRGAFLSALSAGRCVLQLREDTHYYGTMALALLHRALREMGRRMVAAGALDAPEDLFHLRRAELEAWPPSTGLREIAARRKRAREALGEGPLVDPRRFRPAGLERGAVARGTPGSPGLARGPVRVVRSPAEFGTLRAGEVLVAPFTNPAWTPLFQRAAAVVVDCGSAASHAAIVAREYGIPAVMGTGDGTERLTDGQMVRVDGDRGLVLADTGERIT
ncbi:MAG TPA: PEP-utilizing enzyme, partial [Myxococcaceae bacterium]|nr:PEP-utilizing enzyme [Myxococcaceae bacterium]